MTQTYDTIVLGLGGFGSSALYHLARRGQRVLGLEQYGVAHDRGSSHGETRIIRMAYFEHPDYVPLLARAFELWRELESESGATLFHQVGLFLAGRRDGEAVGGTLQAARLHRLPVDELSPTEARQRFPGYHFPDEFQVAFEAQAGYLEVENCVRTYLEHAVRHGAEMRTEEPVVSWAASPSGVRVETAQGTYTARSLVITAGSWTARLLHDLGLPLQVVRKALFWFPAPAQFDVSSGNSTFFFDVPEGQFYGFPRLDGRTLKVAEHTGGDDVADPAAVERGLRPGEHARVAEFLRQYMPTVNPEPDRHSVCLYTKTSDSHFIVDTHPQYPHVAFGAGFSGHGFKFTSSIGAALADLAMQGRTDLPIGFLSLNRFVNRGHS